MTRRILALIVTCVSAQFAWGETYTDEEGNSWQYKVGNGVATLTGVYFVTTGDWRFPVEIEGSPVLSIGDDFNINSSGGSWNKIVIPEGITNIGARAFCQRNNNSMAKLPSSIVTIGEKAFYLTNVESVPPNVVTIGDGAFSACGQLKSLELPSTLKYVGDGAFANSSITNATLPDSLTTIPKAMFYGCTSLSSVNMPNSLISIGDSAFSATPIKSISFPETLKLIGDEAFYGCKNLTSISIPGNVERVGTRSFYFCVRVKDLIIGDGVREIGLESFGNLSVTNVTIPSSVRYIGRTAFSTPDPGTMSFYYGDVEQSDDLSLYVEQDNANYKAVNGVLYSKNGFVLELYPNVKSRQVNHWDTSNMTFVTPDGVVTIGKGACAQRNNETIVVTEGVTNIDDYAFCDTDADLIELPSTLEVIGAYAFSRLQSYWEDSCSISIPSNVTSIGKGAFKEANINELYIPDCLTEVSDELCEDCSSLVNIHISTNAVRIGERAFSACSSVEKVEIPESVERIEAYAFCDCTSLSRIDFYGIFPKDIDELAFYGCPTDMKIHVPKNFGGDETWRGYEVVPDLEVFNSSGDSGGQQTSAHVYLTITNVVVHYHVAAEVPPQVGNAGGEGFVTCITEIDGANVPIPSTWATNYPSFNAKFGNDFIAALMKPTGKKSCSGTDMFVWQDFVAGTDPTDTSSKFTATVTMVNGHPEISWSPNDETSSFPYRVYQVYGKEKLSDENWTACDELSYDNYNFFKVTVRVVGAEP